MTGRDLQRLSGNTSSRVGYMSSKQIRELSASRQSTEKINDESIPTIQDALTMTASSVRQIILDVKVGPPLYEKGLAKDVLSIQCNFQMSIHSLPGGGDRVQKLSRMG